MILSNGVRRFFRQIQLGIYFQTDNWLIRLPNFQNMKFMASSHPPISTALGILKQHGLDVDNIKIQDHEALYRFSIEDPARFWSPLARSYLQWIKPFSENSVMKSDFQKGFFKWFYDGKLNASVNCVDRHLSKNAGNNVALLWEKDEPGQEQRVTYRELYHMMNRIANVLRGRGGVQKGDVVIIYMPVCPMAVATMLACARIGAIHSVIFAGFSAEAIVSRIQDSKAVAVVTADASMRGGKKIPLKIVVDKALAFDGGRTCKSVKTTFVMNRTGEAVFMDKNRDISLEKAMASDQVSNECNPEVMEAEDPLFLLYTSGSTGKPKGLIHSTAGYLLYAGLTHKMVFDYQKDDIFGSVADIGWIAGHSYGVYGPLANGATTLLFESTPIYPDAGRYWEMVQRLCLTQIYIAPTAVRLLMLYSDEFVAKYDRSSLKKIGCVGEPINTEAWNWLNETVAEGRCDIIDTWWQSETGAACISPRPSNIGAEIISAKAMRPLFGIQPVLINNEGIEINGNSVSGSLCLKGCWPGIARSVLNDHARFVETYFKIFPGYYFTGDGAQIDENGHWQITGRMDDVINVSGHRLGTAEVEDALDEIPLVAESAVVGFPHEIKGEGIFAFVVLKQFEEDNATRASSSVYDEMRQNVRNKIASFAVPDKIQICSGLPKTRSGKIMRRILRKIASNKMDDFGDLSTLAEPSVVRDIVDQFLLDAKNKI